MKKDKKLNTKGQNESLETATNSQQGRKNNAKPESVNYSIPNDCQGDTNTNNNNISLLGNSVNPADSATIESNTGKGGRSPAPNVQNKILKNKIESAREAENVEKNSTTSIAETADKSKQKADKINDLGELLADKMFFDIFDIEDLVSRKIAKTNHKAQAYKLGFKKSDYDEVYQNKFNEYKTLRKAVNDGNEPKDIKLKSSQKETDDQLLKQGLENEYIYINSNGNYSVNVGYLASFVRDSNTYFIATSPKKESARHIYLYENGVYNRKPDNEFKSFIKKCLPTSLQKTNMIKDTFELIMMDSQETTKYIDIEKGLNTDEDIINFENGIYKLSTGELLPHSPDYISTIRIPIHYDKNIKKPKNSAFENYINYLTCNDKEARILHLEVLGLAISNIAAYRAKTAFFSIGDHDIGKTILKLFAQMLVGEDNYASITLKELEDTTNKFYSIRLYNKRLVGDNDMSYYALRELNQFKKITGGDPIRGEEKNKSPFDFQFKGLFWSCGNRMPNFAGDRAEKLYERLTIYTSKAKSIEKNKQNKHLFDDIWAERDYIVSIALEALQGFIAKNYRFTTTAEMELEKKKYMESNDTVLQFINYDYKGIVNHTPEEVYTLYKEWREENNVKYEMNKPQLLKELREKGFNTKHQVPIKDSDGNYKPVRHVVDMKKERIKAFANFYRADKYTENKDSPFDEDTSNISKIPEQYDQIKLEE